MDCNRLLKRIKNNFSSEKIHFEKIVKNILKNATGNKDYAYLIEQKGEKHFEDGKVLLNELVALRNSLGKLQSENIKFSSLLKQNIYSGLISLISIVFLFKNIDLRGLLLSGLDITFLIANLAICSFTALLASSIEKIYEIHQHPSYKNYSLEKKSLENKFNEKYNALDEKVAWYQTYSMFLERNFPVDESLVNNNKDRLDEKVTNIEKLSTDKENNFNDQVSSFVNDEKNETEQVKVYTKKR